MRKGSPRKFMFERLLKDCLQNSGPNQLVAGHTGLVEIDPSHSALSHYSLRYTNFQVNFGARLSISCSKWIRFWLNVLLVMVYDNNTESFLLLLHFHVLFPIQFFVVRWYMKNRCCLAAVLSMSFNMLCFKYYIPYKIYVLIANWKYSASA